MNSNIPKLIFTGILLFSLIKQTERYYKFPVEVYKLKVIRNYKRGMRLLA